MHLLYKVIFPIILTLNYSQQDVRFNILHTGDIHGHYKEAAQIATFIQKNKRAKPPAIYLDAGDMFTGTIYFVVGGPRIAADVMNVLHPDGLALGNHEFDRNISGLKEYLSHVGQELLCCNCDLTKEPELEKYFQPSRIVTVDKHKVGIVGYINKRYRTKDNFGNVYFKDELASIQAEVQKLANNGIKIIILLGHGGYDLDQEIAANSRNISVIVGGHTHTFLKPENFTGSTAASGEYPTLIKNKDGKTVPIVHAYYNGEYVGKLEVTFYDNGTVKEHRGNVYKLKKENLQGNSAILKILDKYKKKIAQYKAKIVGESTVGLSSNSCRRFECSLGNLVADSFIDDRLRKFHSKAGNKVWSDVGIVFLNGGALRQGFTEGNKGHISAADIMACIPFSNRIVLLKLDGKTLSDVLEHSISWLTGSKGEFLQFSGIRVVYDWDKPLGQRVVSARLRCGGCTYPKYENLVQNKFYKALTIEYAAKGGDGYTMLSEKAKILEVSAEIDLEIISRYIKLTKLVQSQREERIIILNDKRPKSDEDGADRFCNANLYLISSLVIEIIVNRILFCQRQL